MVRPGRFVVACLMAAPLVLGSALADATSENAAQAAAESWLRLVDGRDYSGSWNQAARLFKASVKETEWRQTAEAVRAPLGNLVSRRLKSRQSTAKPLTTRVIGGKVYTWGPGNYVTIQYDAAFANKPAAIETVIAMADADGAWRVADYSIR